MRERIQNWKKTTPPVELSEEKHDPIPPRKKIICALKACATVALTAAGVLYMPEFTGHTIAQLALSVYGMYSGVKTAYNGFHVQPQDARALAEKIIEDLKNSSSGQRALLVTVPEHRKTYLKALKEAQEVTPIKQKDYLAELTLDALPESDSFNEKQEKSYQEYIKNIAEKVDLAALAGATAEHLGGASKQLVKKWIPRFLNSDSKQEVKELPESKE